MGNNKIVGDKVRDTSILLISNDNGAMISCREKGSNTLNNFLCSVAIDLRQEIVINSASTNLNKNS